VPGHTSGLSSSFCTCSRTHTHIVLRAWTYHACPVPSALVREHTQAHSSALTHAQIRMLDLWWFLAITIFWFILQVLGLYLFFSHNLLDDMNFISFRPKKPNAHREQFKLYHGQLYSLRTAFRSVPYYHQCAPLKGS
jgi:hypothetical protein